MPKSLLLKPRTSEKVYAVSEQLNTYVFDVPVGVNKHQVAAAVAVQYGVGVTNVRIATLPGKSKKAYRKRGRSTPARRADIRKAYVTLKEGDKLPIFSAVDEEVKTDKGGK